MRWIRYWGKEGGIKVAFLFAQMVVPSINWGTTEKVQENKGVDSKFSFEHTESRVPLKPQNSDITEGVGIYGPGAQRRGLGCR